VREGGGAVVRVVLAGALLLLVSGCEAHRPGFGGAGGSVSPGMALAEDVCIGALEARGQRFVRVVQASQAERERGEAIGAELLLEARRDPTTDRTFRVRCEFSYETGRARLQDV
jgi:hypothetical protein